MAPSETEEPISHEALFADIEAALGRTPNDQLATLTALIDKIDATVTEVERLKGELAVKSADLRKLEQDIVPEYMIDVIQVMELRLPDGRLVTVTPFVSAHITEENKPAAYAWLRAHDAGGIIKKELTVVLGKTPDAKVEKLVAKVVTAGFSDVHVGDTVHGATLKKWAKETLAKEAEALREGEPVKDPVPLELFGIFNGRTTKIK